MRKSVAALCSFAVSSMLFAFHVEKAEAQYVHQTEGGTCYIPMYEYDPSSGETIEADVVVGCVEAADYPPPSDAGGSFGAFGCVDIIVSDVTGDYIEPCPEWVMGAVP